MIYKNKSFISSLLIFICSAGFAHGSDQIVNIISLVEKTVTDPNVGWSLEWQRQYIDSISQALIENNDKPDYEEKIEIIRNAFPKYWDSYKTSKLSQIKFEMCKAEIRWYCQELIENALASTEDKALLKTQIHNLCDYATEHLKGQFPFLSEIYINEGKKAALIEFDCQLEISFIPIFRKPFSNDQIQTIKSNWAGMYKQYYSIWRNVRFSSWDREDMFEPNDIQGHPQTRFVKICLSLLPMAIWPTLERPPEYVIDVIVKLNKEKNAKILSEHRSYTIERIMASASSNQIEQVEQWSFIFTALLETAIFNEKKSSSSANPRKGGDAYGLREKL